MKSVLVTKAPSAPRGLPRLNTKWDEQVRAVILHYGARFPVVQRYAQWLLCSKASEGVCWFPQGSGAVFVVLPMLLRCLHKDVAFVRLLRSPAMVASNIGLASSSLVFWNYVMHQTKRGRWYELIYGVDFIMVGTISLISTFPHTLHTVAHFGATASVFGATMVGHYLHNRSLDGFRLHHYACVLSTVVGVLRSFRTRRWTPTLLRTYSTLVCTLLFYSIIHNARDVSEYQQMAWWLPWMWHVHAAVCQWMSLEMAHTALH